MTKKHFQKLAQAIKKIPEAHSRNVTAVLIGEVCAEINTNFNWGLWFKACDVERES